MKQIALVMSVAHYMSDMATAEVADDFERAGFAVLRERREPELFAGPQYLLPTAVVLYVLKPYSGKFLGKLAEDNYGSLKLLSGSFGRYVYPRPVSSILNSSEHKASWFKVR